MFITDVLAKLIRIFTYIFLLMSYISCETAGRSGDDVKKILDFVESFSQMTIQGGHERVMFHDPLVRKKHLGDGWFLKSIDERDKFPWPIFTISAGQVRMEWNQRFDRRVAIKILNISADTPSAFLDVTLNGIPVAKMPGDQPPGRMEFFLPAENQRNGLNLLALKLRSQLLPERGEISDYALHSIEVTYGAAVRTAINLDYEIRPGILLASPISIKYPVSLHPNQSIVFDFGVYSPKHTSKTAFSTYTLDIRGHRLDDGVQFFKNSIKIDTAEPESYTWQHFQMDFHLDDYTEGYITFRFNADDYPVMDSEYLAISAARIVSKEKMEKPHPPKMPDLMLVTLGSVGANILPVYGYSNGRTPSLNRLSQFADIFREMQSVSNGDEASLMSMSSGLLPRDHGIYNSETQFAKSIPSFIRALTQSGYQAFGIVCSTKNTHEIFSKMDGFERVFLTKTAAFSSDILLSNFKTCMELNKSGEQSRFIWIHLDPEFSYNPNENPISPLTAYSLNAVTIDDVNLPINEQNRLKAMLKEKSDIRFLLEQQDHFIFGIDRLIGNLIREHLVLEPSRDLIWAICSTHGIERSFHSNILSTDSLSQEILHVPFLTGIISTHPTTPATIITRIHPLTSLGELLFGKIQSDTLSHSKIITWKSEPSELIAEHCSRRIVAFRRGDYKLIYCLSEPYFRIASTNLFHLKEDPSESINLIGKDPHSAKELLNTVMAFCRDGECYPEPKKGIVEEANEVLMSIGYATN